MSDTHPEPTGEEESRDEDEAWKSFAARNRRIRNLTARASVAEALYEENVALRRALGLPQDELRRRSFPGATTPKSHADAAARRVTRKNKDNE